MKTPFTIDQFLEVFQQYNQIVFPWQIIFGTIGVAILIYILRKNSRNLTFVNLFLSVLWLWGGVIYHIGFFSKINQAAYIFGMLFIIQGGMFLIHSFKKNTSYEVKSKPQHIAAFIIIIYGIVLYPSIGYLFEKEHLLIISLGLPCPTVITTFGFLLLFNKIPGYMLIVPTFWSLAGLIAAINFHIYQDFIMLGTSILFFIFYTSKNNANDFLRTSE